ncbi:MAG: hypothetical protein Q8P13_02900 [bacterium]|nr:hypothetical protein [bacterium]
MNLPEKETQKQKGQILIVFLLVLVVGIAIVLSVASRTLTDIRTTTTSEESNRAYFAAEAGVESALKKISQSAGSVAFSLDFSAVNQTNAVVSGKPFQSGTDGFYAFADNIAKDDVAQFVLLNNFNNLGGGAYGTCVSGPCSPATVDIYWQDPASAEPPATAIEVSLIYYSSGNYSITKWAFDPDSSRAAGASGNNFCSANVIVLDPAQPTGNPNSQNQLAANLDNQLKKFKYKATINVSNGLYSPNSGTNCVNTAGSVAVDTVKVMLRIRPLYNHTAGVSRSEPIGVRPQAGAALPPQGFVVESTGRTASGVTRKLRVIQPYPSLPAIFDYVLFNGSNQPLTK